MSSTTMADTERTRPIARTDAPTARETSTPPSATPTGPARTVDLVPWVGWVLGGAMVVWGLVAMARIGFETFDLYAATEVAGIGVSTLLAIIVTVFGLMVWGAVARVPNRIAVRTYGAVALVFGLVTTIEPDSFSEYLGIGQTFGPVAAGIGAVLVAVSLTSPFSVGTRTT